MALVKKKLTIEEVWITPEMAKSWLSQNSALQRNLSKLTVDAFARDMKAGNWPLTHQGIAFNEAGILVDGQHRLHAIIEAGVKVLMLVTRGLVMEVTGPIDIGHRRGNSYILGRSTKWVAAMNELGRLRSAEMGNFRATPSWLQSIYNDHREEADAVNRALGDTISGPVRAACMYAFPLNPDKLHSFMVQIKDGELLQRGDPAFALRNWLQIHRGKLSTSQGPAFATLNCISHELQGAKLANVYTGESGYRWVTTKRRAANLPFTPSPEEVLSFSGTRQRNE